MGYRGDAGIGHKRELLEPGDSVGRSPARIIVADHLKLEGGPGSCVGQILELRRAACHTCPYGTEGELVTLRLHLKTPSLCCKAAHLKSLRVCLCGDCGAESAAALICCPAGHPQDKRDTRNRLLQVAVPGEGKQGRVVRYALELLRPRTPSAVFAMPPGATASTRERILVLKEA